MTTINVIDDEACPVCGAIWGHENPDLDFPNRPKVGDEQGRWWWKCYNPNCNCGYYLPETGEWERKNTPEEDKEMAERVKAYIDTIDFDKIEVTIIE